MEAWGLLNSSQSPHQSLLAHAQKAVARFESCQVNLKSGILRILPLSNETIAVEGISDKGNRRFVVTVATQSWKLIPHPTNDQFHKKLGEGEAALNHLSEAISEAFRTGRIEKISADYAFVLQAELFPKPVLLRGDDSSTGERDPEIIAAWMTVDSILQAPTNTKRLERAITDESGKVVSHLLITYQEPKKRFILEMWPFPRPFDSRPGESITLTKDTISHFDPDGPEPFSSKERAFTVFRAWIELWGPKDVRA